MKFEVGTWFFNGYVFTFTLDKLEHSLTISNLFLTITQIKLFL